MEGGIQYKLEGTKDIIEAMDSLDPKELLKLLKSVNRKALNKEIIKPLRAALPYGAKTKKGVKVLADKELKGDSLFAGVSSDSFWLRFLEKGTKIRTAKSGANRGQITARPIVENTIMGNTDDVIDYFNKDFGNQLVILMQRKIKRINK